MKNLNQDNALNCLKSIAFRITDLCNLSCSMCGQAKYYKSVTNKSNHYLELDHLKNIIDQVEKYKPQVYIWGGEPLLYPKLGEFLEILHNKRMNSFITTNGVWLDKFIKPLVDYKVAQIAISLDGFPDTHEKIRGKVGIYQKIIDNIRLLEDYKASTKRVLPIVDIHIVVVKENYREIYDFVKHINGQGLCRRIRIQLPMFFTQKMSDCFSKYVEETFKCKDPKSWYGFVGSYNDMGLEALKMNMQKIKSEFKNVIFFPSEVNLEEDLDKWFLEPEKYFSNKCMTCWHRINIEPCGDLVSCTDFPETVYGNVKNETIEEMFNNSIITNHRNSMSKSLAGICSRCSYLYVY